MRTCYLLPLLFLFAAPLCQAQLVKFSKIPVSYQLYPRNTNSLAIIPIAGRVMLLGYNRVSMQVFRNNTLYRYAKQPLAYAGNTAPFALTATIPAELAQFRIRIFVHQTGSTDSVQVADRQDIVAGDVFVINGQSNASAYIPRPNYTYQSEYIRTFGVYTNNSNLDPYSPADTLWSMANGSPSTLAGTWAMEMARQILTQYGVPVCIINGAAGGAGIEYLSIRNTGNPTDLNTNYGRLLYRVRKAGLTGVVKAYFFRQGENETSGNAPIWPSEFDKLYQNVRLDYPEISRFYLFQIHLLGGNLEPTAVFRDYQRRAASVLPLVQTHATIGTKGYDGIHFSAAGHSQTGAEVFRLVARDFYGGADNEQITSPDVQKIYFNTPAKNELVVQFDEGQQLVWPNDTTVLDAYGSTLTHQLRQWLLLDKQAGGVVSGRADGYRLILTLNGSRAEQKLSYLTPNYPLIDGGGNPLPGYARAFPGPFIKNRRGLGAFSFWEVSIGASLAPLTNFVANIVSDTAIQLSWIDHPVEQTYVLERKRPFDGGFIRVVQLPAGSTSFIDRSLSYAVTYQYRLRAVTTTSETTADASATINCPAINQLTSVQGGNWNQAATWNCGRVPAITDKVRISAGHAVTLNQVVVVKGLALFGTLRFQPGGTVRLVP